MFKVILISYIFLVFGFFIGCMFLGYAKRLFSYIENNYVNTMSELSLQCSCGVVLQNVLDVRKHWQMGHFDTPVYEEKE